MRGLILQFAYDYTDENRLKMKPYATLETLLGYLKKQNLVEAFARYGEKNGLKRRNLMIKKSNELLQRFIYGRIIYNMLDDEAFIRYFNEEDPTIRKALEVMDKQAAFPKRPADEKPQTKKE